MLKSLKRGDKACSNVREVRLKSVDFAFIPNNNNENNITIFTMEKRESVIGNERE